MEGVSDLDLGKEEDNVELSLGLSIGGSSFRKRLVWISASEIGGIEDKDHRSVVGSTVDPALVFEAKGSSGGDFLDPKSKRDMHALRRQEARKKMGEKQMKKKNDNGNGSDRIVSLLGFYSNRRRHCLLLLVYDLMLNDSLQDALIDRKCPEFTIWIRRLSIALDIARWLEFLKK